MEMHDIIIGDTIRMADETSKCGYCDGTGKIIEEYEVEGRGFGGCTGWDSRQIDCHKCKGTGRIPTPYLNLWKKIGKDCYIVIN